MKYPQGVNRQAFLWTLLADPSTILPGATFFIGDFSFRFPMVAASSARITQIYHRTVTLDGATNAFGLVDSTSFVQLRYVADTPIVPPPNFIDISFWTSGDLSTASGLSLDPLMSIPMDLNPGLLFVPSEPLFMQCTYQFPAAGAGGLYVNANFMITVEWLDD